MLARQSLALVCGLFVAGCTASAPKQVEHAASLPAPATDGTYKVQFPDPGHYVGRNHRLAIGPAEPVQCRFSPHFALGSAEPLPQDMLDLESMADCLQSEPARERPIEIIGHADVRGSSARNVKLARMRAERVRDILVTHGVDAARIQVRSVGEHGALGFLSAYSHGFDRRVDIALVYDAREPSDTNRYDVAAWR
jgi:OOP family OmpA-OmpF porin